MTDKKIAATLGISVRTVSNYLTNLYAILGCENRTQLALLASQARTEIDGVHAHSGNRDPDRSAIHEANDHRVPRSAAAKA